MLAHSQASLLKAAALGWALGVEGKTVSRYLDLLVQPLLGLDDGCEGWFFRPQRQRAEG